MSHRDAGLSGPPADPTRQRDPCPSGGVRPSRAQGRPQHGSSCCRGRGGGPAAEAGCRWILLVGQFADTKARIDAITTDLRSAAEADETARRLQTMPGIGPITASVLAATLPDVSAFRSARDLSAWLGLTPKPHSSGGKERLGTISKMGNRYVRRLLYLRCHGGDLHPQAHRSGRTNGWEGCWRRSPSRSSPSHWRTAWRGPSGPC